MSKSIVSILLSMVFMALIITPTIIIIIDDSVDISCFYDSGEEEEKASEKNKDIEIVLAEHSLFENAYTSVEIENNLEYFFKTYSKPHLNIISPPPDFYLL